LHTPGSGVACCSSCTRPLVSEIGPAAVSTCANAAVTDTNRGFGRDAVDLLKDSRSDTLSSEVVEAEKVA